MAKGSRVHDSSATTVAFKTGNSPNDNNGTSFKTDPKDAEEPKEHDKCIETPQQQSPVSHDTEMSTEPTTPTKLRRRLDMFEAHFQRRKSQIAQLSSKKKTIIITQSIFIAILLVITIVLAVYLAKANSRKEPPTLCTTPNCLIAASQIISSLNKSANPCTDFYSYVCSGWQGKNPVPRSDLRTHTVLNELERRITYDLRHYFDLIPLKYDEKSFEWKAKKFYKVCLDQEEYEAEADQAFKYIVGDVGGWKLLNSWTLGAWSRDNALERLHAKYATNLFFKVSITADDFSPNQFIIKLSPDGLLLGDRSYYTDPNYEKLAVAYKQYMTDVAKQFGGTPFEANLFAQNTFHYEKRIAEVSPDFAQETDLAFNDPTFIKLRIRELQSRSPSFRWLKFFQGLFPYSAIKESTSIIVEHPEYFSKISTIISSSDEETLHNFYVWRLIVNYIQFLSKPFRVIEHEFKRSMAGILQAAMPLTTSYNQMISPYSSVSSSYSPLLASQSIRLDDQREEDRWSFCVKTTSQFLDLAVGSIYVTHKFGTSSEDGIDRVRSARNMIDTILKNMVNHADNINWIKDAATRDAVKEKLRSMLPIVGYPDLLFNRDKLTKHYEELLVQGNFLRNIEHAIFFRQKKLDELLRAPVSPDYQYITALSAQDPKVAYNYVGNLLLIGGGILQSPIYTPSSSPAVQYGSFGFLLANEILRAFDVKGVGYSQYGALNTPTDWLGSKSNETYIDNLECLSDSLERLLLTHPIHLPLSETSPLNMTVRQFASDSMVDAGALRYAFGTYQEVARSYPALHLPGLSDYGINNNDQLFFVSFGQALCESTRTNWPSVTQSDSNRNRLPASIRILNMFNQVSQFRDAFNCHSSSSSFSPFVAGSRQPKTCTLW